MEFVFFVPHDRLVEVHLPIEENPEEIVSFIAGLPLVVLLIDVYLSPSPLRYLRIVLPFSDGEDMLSEKWDAEVGVGAEELSKDAFDFLSFVVEKGQGFLQEVVEKLLVL